MRSTITAIVATLLFTGAPVFAQSTTAVAVSGSQSGALSGSKSQSFSQGGGGGNATQGVFIDQRAPGTVRSDNTTRIIESGTKTVRTQQSGTVRNEFAPSMPAPAMGSGHPCGLGNSLGISIIGGGVSGGATRVDDACLLAQMGYTRAATLMVASRSASACKALVATGEIAPNSYCGASARKDSGIYDRRSLGPVQGPAAQGKPMAVKPQQVSAGNVAPVLAVASSRGPVCVLKAGTKNIIVTDATTQQGRMACAARLGL